MLSQNKKARILSYDTWHLEKSIKVAGHSLYGRHVNIRFDFCFSLQSTRCVLLGLRTQKSRKIIASYIKHFHFSNYTFDFYFQFSF